MRNFLLSILCAATSLTMVFAAKTDPKGELAVVFSENFDALSSGTESSPASEEISAGGKLDASLTGGLEWQGRGLHQAGGSLAVMHFEQSDWFGTESLQGYVRTPYTDVRMDDGNFTLRFKARALTGTTAILHVEVYDPYTTNSLDTGKVEITGDWGTYELDLRHPGYGNHLAFMEIASEGEDWLLDDLEIIQDYYDLPAPIVHFARNVSYEEFTGRWNPVTFAEGYLVSVYSLDDAGVPQYLVKEEKTSECTLTVSGTQKGKDYFYYVKSFNDKYTSPESEHRRVYVSLNALDTPMVLEAENISTDGFTARWEPTFRAMGYVVGLKKQYIAAEDKDATIMAEDFEKIRTGTTGWPEIFYGNIDDYVSMPGWDYNYFTSRTAKGMFGLDISYKKYGEPCYLSTPVLDLSGASGKFTIELRVFGGKGNVVSLTCGRKTQTHTLEVDGLQEFSMEFDNGSEESVIRIDLDGESSCTYLLIDDIKVRQSVKAGDKVTENVSNHRTETPDTSFEFTGLNAKEGDTFVYTVTAWSYTLDEDGIWGPDVFSEVSAPQEVLIKASDNAVDGVLEDSKVSVSVTGKDLVINTSEASEAMLYSVDGRLIGSYALLPGSNVLNPSYAGVLIVRIAGETFRVLMH